MTALTSKDVPTIGSATTISELIEMLDWNGSSLGARAQWPQAVNTILAVILDADVPMAILLGSDGVALYNDAYAGFVGDLHPTLFGHSIIDQWPQQREYHKQILSAVSAEQKVAHRDHHLIIEHKGSKQDTWANLDYSPIRGEDGQVIATLAIAKDTTARMRVEQRLRVAQEAGGVGTFEWYPETGTLDVSDEYRRIWGLSPDTPVTDEVLVALLDPDDRVHAGTTKLADDNPLAYSEYRRIEPSTGEVRWIARRGEVLSNPGSAQRRYVGIAFDITARKAAEDAVRASEAKWRGLFEQMQEAFFVGQAIRSDNGKMVDFDIIELNPAFEHHTGLSAEQVLGASIRDVIPGVPDSLIESYARVVDSGEPETFEVYIEALGNRWYEARARKSQTDRFAVLFVDISARKQAEERVRESAMRFRTLAQSMPNHVWTAAPDGQLDWFNDRVYAYAGAPEGSLDGDGWAAMVHPDDISSAAEMWADARAKQQQYEIEFRLRRHDGAYRWHIARAVPIRADDGSVDRWIGTNTDIDDQKAAEAALAEFTTTLEDRVEARTAELVKMQEALRQSQKMESIGNLTGGVAHDFNNLLQVVSGNLQLLSKDIAGNDRAEQRVQNALEGVSRGARLASQLLAFGRRQPLAPKVVNLARLIRNMDEMLRRALGEAVEIETVIGGGLWNTLIDPSNVENAILNLAINARDAMEGQGKLTIEAGNAFLDAAYARSHVDVQPGQYVMLAVTDTGSGMSAETAEKVFEPFFSTKPEGKGTGLGLSMVYGFVKQSGGHIKIYSELGHGTTIKLYMPRSTQAEDVLVAIDTGPVTGGTETILVAEDDQAVRETVIATLTDLGYRVLQAADAQAALNIIESGIGIDLLFTDVVMPGTLKSAELSRKAVERLPNLGVLFTSGYTENSIVHAGRLDDGVELLSKPYTREALARKLRHVLSNTAQRKLSLSQRSSDAVQSPKSEASAGEKPSILVCEDDALIRMSTVDMLEELGHVVFEAGDAKAALQILQDQKIDFLLTDVGLPDMSGVMLAERARATRTTLAVIFATGHAHLDGVEEGPTTTLLTKPYSKDALQNSIARLWRAK